jgi:RNA-directed DNA polymerase
MITRLISILSEHSGLSVADVSGIVSSAPRRYKVFEIPKRNNRGVRVIAQPSRELKVIQRIVLSTVLRDMPVHMCVHGYVHGRSIKSNAAVHTDGRYLLKLDLENFFPSLVPRDLRAHIANHCPARFGLDEIMQLCRILFWQPKGEPALRLSVGAPSSPFLSNTLMFDVDRSIWELCVSLNVSYSRYADDMTFSTGARNVLSAVHAGVRDILAQARYPRVVLNGQKVVNSSKKHLRAVTGVVISNEAKLSLGRDRKRLIRAMAHRSSLGLLGPDEEARLDGLISFAHDIEPVFALAIRRHRLGE